MGLLLVSAAAAFGVAAVLALTTPSSWPFLLARVILIALGILLIVVGLRRRRGKAL